MHDSPFTVPIILSPETTSKSVIITGLNGPFGTAVFDNGNIVVAECTAHCITILNKKGKRMRSFGINRSKEVRQLKNPRRVAITMIQTHLGDGKLSTTKTESV